MEVTLLGIFKEVILIQSAKASLPIVSTLFGIETTDSFPQSSNA
jgi:hypothetical protein